MRMAPVIACISRWAERYWIRKLMKDNQTMPKTDGFPRRRYARALLPGLLMTLQIAVFTQQSRAQAVTLVPNATRYTGIGPASRGYNSDFGSAGTVELNSPAGLAVDTGGNLLIVDRTNNCIRREDSTQLHLITTLAGLKSSSQGDTCNAALNATPTPAQGLLTPSSVAVDLSNNVYIADAGHNCIRMLVSGSSGVSNMQTVAGTCGASATASTTPMPQGLATDSAGNLYISIQNTADGVFQVLRHAANSAANTLCRVAGDATAQGIAKCADVTGSVSLSLPTGIALDGAGSLYIADTGNNCIRKLSGGTFSTALGTCGSVSSAIRSPLGVTFSLAGNMFVSLGDANQVVRYNQGTGQLLVVAGNVSTAAGAYSSQQDGAAASAVPLNAPMGVVEDASNNLFVADSGNGIVRALTFGNLFPQTAASQASAQQVLAYQINVASNLTVTVGKDYALVAGTNSCDGAKTPTPAGSTPAYCSVGVIFTPTQPGARFSPITVADSSSGTRIVSGLQGTGIGPQVLLFQGTANTFAAGLGGLRDLSRDSQGNVYVLRQSTAVDAQVLRYPVGGGAPTVLVPAGAGLKQPTAIAADAAGNWYVTDLAGSSTGGPTVQRYGADGSINLNYVTGIVAPRAISVDGFGNLLIAEQGTANDLLKVYQGGERYVMVGGGTTPAAEGVTAAAVQLTTPSGVALGPNGTVYLTDSGAHRVYSVDTAGLFHVIAGDGGTTTSTITQGALNQSIVNPTDVDVDAAGDIFIVDSGANKVFTLFASANANTNLVRIFGRTTGAQGVAGDGSESDFAYLNDPEAVTITPDGTVYVADAGNSRVRSITFPIPTLNYGTVAVGSINTLTQALWNDGNGNLFRNTDPAVSKPNFQYNDAASTCGQAIIPGLLCNFAFTFFPTVTGPDSAVATVADSATTSPQHVNLVANVVATLITGFTAAPETENYGGPYVGTAILSDNGGTVPNGTVTFTLNGTVVCTLQGNFLNAITCTLPGGSGLHVGTYPVVVKFVGNYPTQTTNTTLQVMPRVLTETVNNKSKRYLQPNPVLDGVPNGLLSGNGTDSFTVTYSTTVTQTSTPQLYAGAITATFAAGPGTDATNYTINVVPGDFLVQPALLLGGAVSSGTQVYGGTFSSTFRFTPLPGAAAPTGTMVFSAGGRVLCTLPISTPATTCVLPAGTGLNVGTYPVVANYSGDALYQGQTFGGAVTVTPAPLTLTVNNQAKAFGAAVPVLTGTYSGLVNGDVAGTTIGATYSTTVTATTPIGTYPNSITAVLTGSSATNYTVQILPGSFQVGVISTTTTLTSSTGSAASGAAVTFTALVSSAAGAIPNGTVIFSADGVSIGSAVLDATGAASVTTTTLKSGTRSIVATYSGNAAFGFSSATLSQVVTVPSGTFTLSATPDTQLIRGPGNTTYQVTITSKNGFAGPVSLTCSGLPADASCTLGQTLFQLAANGTATTTLITTTVEADAIVARNMLQRRDDAGGLAITAAAALPMELSGLGLLVAGIRRRKKMRLLPLLALGLGMLGLAGCGCPNTAFHTYPITVIGTSVNGGPAPVSTKVYLSVGQTIN